jgi:hypothetical protein
MADRLDSEQIELLRAWGVGLATDERDEVRAAGKAITMLVDEIDRLNIDIWNQRAGEEREIEAAVEPALGSALRDRLRRRTSSSEQGASSYNSRRSARLAASYSARARCTAGSAEISATGTSHQLS